MWRQEFLKGLFTVSRWEQLYSTNAADIQEVVDELL